MTIGRVIAELTPALAPAAVALWHDVGLTRPWNDPQADLRRALDGPTSTVLALVEGGVLVGTVMTGYDGHRGWLYYVAVRPDRQGEGVGRSLVTAAEEWLRGHGCPKAQLMVRHTNTAARGFYERLGYADAETVVLGRFLT